MISRARRQPVEQLYLRELGSRGTPIVFLPGVGGTTRYFESRVTSLAAENRLLLVDPLGFGQSPKPWVRYSLDRHLAAFHRTVGDRGPFVLVGHSFGAILALAYASRHPANVAGLVLLSLPHFGGEDGAVRYLRTRLGLHGWVMTHMVLAAAACLVTRRLLGWMLPLLLRNLPREVAEDLVRHTWRSSTSTVWESVYRHDVAADADALPLNLPVYLVHGAVDRIAPLDSVRALETTHPSWQLEILPGVDHHPLLRAPGECVRLVRAATNASVSPTSNPFGPAKRQRSTLGPSHRCS